MHGQPTKNLAFGFGMGSPQLLGNELGVTAVELRKVRRGSTIVSIRRQSPNYSIFLSWSQLRARNHVPNFDELGKLHRSGQARNGAYPVSVS